MTPLSSGGLWLAVTTKAPRNFFCITSQLHAGVTNGVWVKRGSTANDARVYTSWYDANNQGWITFTNNTVGFFIYQSSSYSVQVLSELENAASSN